MHVCILSRLKREKIYWDFLGCLYSLWEPQRQEFLKLEGFWETALQIQGEYVRGLLDQGERAGDEEARK